MAVQPDTTTGTLTTTAGSINFTTSGTQMLTRGHLPGDRFLVNGLELQIATITGENTGTLTEVCPASAAVSGFPVRLRFQPDGARVAAQTRNLIDVLGNGTLQSIAGLNGVGGNKGIVFTGAGSAETFALTSFALTLLDDESANAAVGTLGLLPVQSSETDATTNRLLRTGAFGLGIQSVSTETNLNNYLTPGKYITTSVLTNAPPGWPSGLRGVIEVAGGPSYSSQIITRPDTGESYSRGSIGTAFTPWRGLSSSMTSNANGVCFRFAGGLQICWQPAITLTYVNPSVLGALWTYPAAFASTPFLTITPTAQPIASHRESTAYTLPYASTSSGRLELIDNAASYPVGSTQAANGLAIGLY